MFSFNSALKQMLDCYFSVNSLLFSEESQYVKINRELLSLKPRSISSNPSGACLNQESSTCGVLIREDWVTRDRQDVIWLPLEGR